MTDRWKCPKCGKKLDIMEDSTVIDSFGYVIGCLSCTYRISVEKMKEKIKEDRIKEEKKTNLKPCPFCGSVNLSLTQDNFGYWGVECHGNACHAYLSNAKWACERKEDAIAMWNRRVEE